MWGWIIVALYALGMGLFQMLGGLGAAAEALNSWGAAHSSSEEIRARSSR
jgi:hypothetical protein